MKRLRENLTSRYWEAAQRLQPGDELSVVEGLHQIVVRPGAQAFHPVLHTAQRREHQHRHGAAFPPGGAHQLQPRKGGQHPVHHRRVVWVLQKQRKAAGPVGGFVASKPRLFQHGDKHRAQGFVVLDQQNSHPRPSFVRSFIIHPFS